MFGLFKKKLNYSSWSCSIFDELKELSLDGEQITNEYNTLRNSDIITIKRMGFKSNSQYEFKDLKRMKYILNEGGILIKREDIISIAIREDMRLENVNAYNGGLTSTNIKDIINLRTFLDKASCDFKYFEKKTYKAPPNTDWVESYSYMSFPSLYSYKREAKLQILHNQRGTFNKIIFVPVTMDILTPIILIKSERKNKIDGILEK